MQTVAAKRPESPKSSHELAVDLVRCFRTSGVPFAELRQREAELSERLLNDACDAARRELREKEEHDRAWEAGELVAGARVTVEPCPSCKGSGKLSRHAVTYPRLWVNGAGRERLGLAPYVHAGSPCSCGNPTCPSGAQHAAGAELGPMDVHHPRELEAIRERDQARAERDAMHERCAELEADRAQLRRENQDAWHACPHFPSGATYGSTLAEAIAFLRKALGDAKAMMETARDEAAQAKLELSAAQANFDRVLTGAHS